MKKLLIIISILAILVGLFWFSQRDLQEEFVDYQAYKEELQEFKTNKGVMRYRDSGSGPVILLIHGVPTSSWMYRYLGDSLVSEGYRVIAPDLMGFGASDRMPTYYDYDFDKQSQILVGLMDHLGIDTWQQVTHDMGGLVTWHMSRDVPERIDHLYILNTIIYKDTFNPPASFDKENKIHLWFLGLHGHPFVGKLIVNNMMNSGTGDSHTYSGSDRVGYWLPIRSGAGALVHFFTHSKDIKENLETYRTWLIDSKIPVSVLWGQGDPFLDVGSALRLQDDLGLEPSDVVILEGAKHLVAEESYQEIADFIINKNN